MIEQDKRQAILLLYQQGKGKRDIARLLEISRNTVSHIITTEGQMPKVVRKDTIEVDEERLRQLHHKCGGRAQRIHEILVETDQLEIGYSTVTRKLREAGLTAPPKQRCEKVPDVPGEEMQHDTSVHFVMLGTQKTKVVTSLLYFRYSKIRYLKFYRHFDRFRMQCFFHEALSYIGYAAQICIIDNTNLARLHGTGKQAVICPEMEQFSKRYGFAFVCHALNHPNRKAGNERGFYTVETNFFPGRQFNSMEALNRSAFEWATVRQYHRPVGKARVVPAKAFEYERSFLNRLPAYVQAPYRDHHRVVDQYGYVAFGGNYYLIPDTDRKTVTLLEYETCLKIYFEKRLLIEYELPEDTIRNQTFYPKGYQKPVKRPKNRKQPTQREEKILRSLSTDVDKWLNSVLKEKGIGRHPFIRKLYGLHLKLAPGLFLQTIKRAAKYRIHDPDTIEQIAALLVRQSGYEMPSVDIDHEFKNRNTYQEGSSLEPTNLNIYDNLLEEPENE